MIKRRYLIFLLIVLSFVSLFLGVSTINLQGLLNFEGNQWQIFFISRVPRLISILIAGASLSICGLVMQQLSRNRFVSPTTAGTMDSARLGILMAMLFFPTASMLLKTTIAVIVSFLGTLLFMTILSRLKFKDTIFVPLVGIMFGNIISSITAFIAYKEDLLQNLSGWLQGDFSLVMSGRYELLYFSIPTLIVAYLFAHRFSIVGMGKDFAVNLGLNYNQVLYLGLLIVAVVSSIIIVSVGVIPFLGLIIPNIVTLYLGDNLKKVLSHTALLGAVFVLFCDILGRSVIYPYEISINAVVGVFGSGIFLFLLLKRLEMAKKSSSQLIVLSLLAMVSLALYLGYNLPNRWQYALENRTLSLIAIVITGAAIALATMIFQTVVNNRILTPSILGLDSLYLLIQTTIIFLFGSSTLLSMNSIALFVLCTGLMMAFSLVLYHFLFKKENQNIFFLLLVGIIFGTFFGSLTTFMEVLIDPNEFQIAQDIGFASFNRINTQILWVALVILVVTIVFSLRYWHCFDVLALGRENAINLGIDYQKTLKVLLILVAILTSVSTALVGPLTFLGLLVMNVTFEFVRDYRHKVLIPAVMLISIITLVLGQLLVTHIFTFRTTLSIIVNFVGGVYFIYLLLRANKKWQ